MLLQTEDATACLTRSEVTALVLPCHVTVDGPLPAPPVLAAPCVLPGAAASSSSLACSSPSNHPQA